MTATATPAEQSREAYLFVFDSFAAGTDEVAKHLGVDRKVALRRLRRLEDLGLVCSEELHDMGGVAVSGPGLGRARGGGRYISLTWQAIPTYDNISREDAEALYAERVGVTRKPEPGPLTRSLGPGMDRAERERVATSRSAEDELASRLPEYGRDAVSHLTDEDLAVLLRVARSEYRRRRRGRAA